MSESDGEAPVPADAAAQSALNRSSSRLKQNGYYNDDGKTVSYAGLADSQPRAKAGSNRGSRRPSPVRAASPARAKSPARRPKSPTRKAKSSVKASDSAPTISIFGSGKPIQTGSAKLSREQEVQRRLTGIRNSIAPDASKVPIKLMPIGENGGVRKRKPMLMHSTPATGSLKNSIRDDDATGLSKASSGSQPTSLFNDIKTSLPASAIKLRTPDKLNTPAPAQLLKLAAGSGLLNQSYNAVTGSFMNNTIVHGIMNKYKRITGRRPLRDGTEDFIQAQHPANIGAGDTGVQRPEETGFSSCDETALEPQRVTRSKANVSKRSNVLEQTRQVSKTRNARDDSVTLSYGQFIGAIVVLCFLQVLITCMSHHLFTPAPPAYQPVHIPQTPTGTPAPPAPTLSVAQVQHLIDSKLSPQTAATSKIASNIATLEAQQKLHINTEIQKLSSKIESLQYTLKTLQTATDNNAKLVAAETLKLNSLTKEHSSRNSDILENIKASTAGSNKEINSVKNSVVMLDKTVKALDNQVTLKIAKLTNQATALASSTDSAAVDQKKMQAGLDSRIDGVENAQKEALKTTERIMRKDRSEVDANMRELALSVDTRTNELQKEMGKFGGLAKQNANLIKQNAHHISENANTLIDNANKPVNAIAPTALPKPASRNLANFADPEISKVIRDRCSPSSTSHVRYVSLLGIPIIKEEIGPAIALKPSLGVAGNCWAFQGSQGRLSFDIIRTIKPTHVTIEYLSGSDSTPKVFSIFGATNSTFLEPEATVVPEEDLDTVDPEEEVESSEDPPEDRREFLGKFELLDTEEFDESAFRTETFGLNLPRSDGLSVFELEIDSNYGNDKFTCIYQVKIHGKAAENNFVKTPHVIEKKGYFDIF